jgi:hypothetical protein
MATGCAPAELLAGGRTYFDALVAELSEERQNGWDVNEQLATLIEISWAQYRALLALAGAKQIPAQIKLPRPGDAIPRQRTSVADLKSFVDRRLSTEGTR